MTQDLPSPDVLRQLLRYEPHTGKLFWRQRPLEMFASERAGKAWNTKYSGKEALTSVCKKDGYRVGEVFNSPVKAHRVAWAVYYGKWPQEQIDHINLMRDDNRINNLRLADSAQNSCNRGIQSNNTSGRKGVSWHKHRKKWTARISINGERHNLGMFKSAESAHAAYCAASEKYHGEFGRHQ